MASKATKATTCSSPTSFQNNNSFATSPRSAAAGATPTTISGLNLIAQKQPQQPDLHAIIEEELMVEEGCENELESNRVTIAQIRLSHNLDITKRTESDASSHSKPKSGSEGDSGSSTE
jgi:hypothetical protein